MARVVLAMSGGVDSSVAAHLLCEAGHEVTGVFMRHGHPSEPGCLPGEATSNSAPGCLPGAATSNSATACASAEQQRKPQEQPASLAIVEPRSEHKQGCCSASDAADARRVADRLGLPFYAVDFQEEFDRIIDYFVDEYANARTPNPCVMCNNHIKFGRLLDYADSVGAEFVATGHYARLVASPAGGFPALRRGRDRGKDQSYVLFGLASDVLPRVLFPVGDYRKPRIREIAASIGLRVAEKKDSQEICFVPSGRHWDLVRARRPAAGGSGEIVTTEGRVVGKHDGIERFTVGQRKGLGVAMGEPYFVVRLEPGARRVVIGRHGDLGRTHLTAARTNWLVDLPEGPTRCQAQIRYNSSPSAGCVEVLPGARMRIEFDSPQCGVAPGQAVVCYAGDRVLGGGWIE